MGSLNQIKVELHKIKVKLYPNYLSKLDGAYIARTSNEATLSIEQICASLKIRGGYTGDHNDLVDKVKKFYDEVAYQLCDGFAVNTGYYSIHPRVRGFFNSMNEGHDNKKNPISFRFRHRALLRKLVKVIDVNIEGLANVNGYIDEFLDYDESSINSKYVSDNQFCISGHKIKIAGENPDCGLYFVPVEDPQKAVKVKRIAENTPTKIIGIEPKSDFVQNRIEIRTQFTGSANTFLKKPRIIRSNFILGKK